MNELNNKLDGLSELVTRIDAKILEISTKLDELIKALHDYDGNDEYGESSFEAFIDTKNDILNWGVDGAERRMDIIGQNGNEGSHYVTNEEADEDAAMFDDYGKRIVWVDENKSNNNPAKHVGKKKYNNKYYKKPNTPVTPKK